MSSNQMFNQQIISKWVSGEILITANADYYLKDGTQLIKEVHQGCLKLRIPKTSIRFSYKKLNKNKVLHNELIHEYCPF